MAWKNIFHWGPLFSIAVIKLIVWSVVHCNSMWWPPYESFSGFTNAAVFLLLAASTLYNFLYSLHVGPGFLPLQWTPANEEDIKYLQYCTACEGYKAPRSHHCRKCNRCILKRDHHCIFINICVGHLNHTSFILFLVSAVVGCCHACVVIACSMYRALRPNYYYYDYGIVHEPPYVNLGLWSFLTCLISLGLAAGVVCSVGFLFFIQMKIVLRNQTGIEDWVIEKASYRREGTDEPPFVHPYNVGWRENLRQVINWKLEPVGDGINWKVKEGCHPFSFTMEQKEQKKVKAERLIEYLVEKEYNGKWFPLTQGWRTCLRPPCTDEARIALQVGDIVAVSRWKKYWLYGEVRQRNGALLKAAESRPLRGWFPRSCCVLDATFEESIKEE